MFDIDTPSIGFVKDGYRGFNQKWNKLDNDKSDTEVDYKASRFFVLTGQHHAIDNSVLNESLKLVNK